MQEPTKNGLSPDDTLGSPLITPSAFFAAVQRRIEFFSCLHFGNRAWVSVGFLILRLFALGFLAENFFFS